MPLHSGAFLEQIVRFLMPFFIDTAANTEAARAEILETLGTYAARTRAEMLNAAQIIAFSMSALDVLAEAKTAELSPSQRLRYRGCANGLNRVTQQNEKILARRLSREVPRNTAPAAEPIDDMTEDQVEVVLQQARAKIDTDRSRLPVMRLTNPTPSAPKADHNQQLWAMAMADARRQMGKAADLGTTG